MDLREHLYLDWSKQDRARLRDIALKVYTVFGIACAAALLLVAIEARASHDSRDPDGVCLQLGKLAAVWAETLRDDGKGKAEAEKLVGVTPEQLEGVPEQYRKLVIQSTLKGMELVYDAEPKKTPPEVFETFYEWCLPNLPQKPGA